MPSIATPSGAAPRLAELMGALSLATEMATGTAPETVLGATVLAVRLGRSLGLDEPELAATYYASVMRFVGCTATATEAGALALGRDDHLNYALLMCDWVDADQVEASLDQHLARDQPPEQRRAAIGTLRGMVPQMPSIGAAHCAQAQVLASRLPLPQGVVRLLSHMYDRWDGAIPGASGAGIPLAAQVITLAVGAELFRRAGGIGSAIDLVRRRAAGVCDPALCAHFEREAASLFEGFGRGSMWPQFLQAEPGGARSIEPAAVPTVAGAFADFIDQKCGWMIGHSRQVAALALLAAQAAGLDASERQRVYLAGLMHDIGLAAIPNGILDRDGPLSPVEASQAQAHAHHTRMVLSSAPVLAPVVSVISAAHRFSHESLGGAAAARVTDMPSAILAAADRYHTLTHARPWRRAASAEAAARTLADAVAEGRLPANAVRAVLEAAGHAKRSARRVHPDGLTAREAEVLELLARGHSTKAIAAALAISPKTADHHVQAVYDKTGARSRAAAAIYALSHGIVETWGDLPMSGPAAGA